MGSFSFAENRLFRGLKPSVASELSSILEVTRYPSGSIVFEDGQSADFLYLVGSGCIRISKRGRGGQQETLTTVEPGDFFGEMALYDQQPRSARATAAEDTVLGRVDERGFARMVRRAPIKVSRNLTLAAIERLRKTDEHFIRSVLQAERLSLVGSMVSTIVHDFKNPMSTLVMVTQLMEERSGDPELGRWAGLIRRAVDRMLGMTGELLDYSKGQSELDITEVEIDDLLEELEEQLLMHLPGQGIQVVREIAFRGAIEADRARFGRVLANLVKNSAEAMPGGGTVTLRVELRQPGVAFVISDTGKGMSQELLHRIFEPFVTSGKPNGTGLGMAIVKTIVDAHDGTISIASTENVGTRVEILLPHHAGEGHERQM